MILSKKSLGLFAALALSGMSIVGTAHAANEIKLLSVFSGTGSTHGLSWQWDNVAADVKNISATKRVVLHFKKPDGVWADVDMMYWSPSPGGKEIWRISNQECNSVYCTKNELEKLPLADLEFTLRLEANGQKFSDNNGGANYKIAANYGYGLYTRDVLNFTQFNPSYSGSKFNGTVLVKEPASGTTVVKVHYSTNNWASQKIVSAVKMTGNENFGGYGHWPNPSAQKVSGWSFTADVGTASTVSYCVEYVKNGVSVWDNNGGANYKAKRRVFGTVLLRGTFNAWGSPEGQRTWLDSRSDYQGNVTLFGYAGFNGAGDDFGVDRFKFDMSKAGDGSVTYGDNQPDGIAELGGLSIKPKAGPAVYRISLAEQTRKYLVTKVAGNIPPVAKAGPDLTVKVGTSAPFDATTSYDLDGTINSFQWDILKTDGSWVERISSDTGRGEYTFTQAGDYVVTLYVNDGQTSSIDKLKVKVTP